MWIVKQVVIRLVLFTFFSKVITAQYIGDSCYHSAEGAPGTCKSFGDCPAAIQGLSQNKIPQNCGFDGSVPIVCCVSGTQGPTPTAKPTTRTTTTRAPKPVVTVGTPKPTKPLKVGEKSTQKCQEYREYTYIIEKSPLALFSGGGTIKTDQCPFTAKKLIIGGEPVKADEFPHMAAIGYNNGNEKVWDCGGSLISESFVLTAAHCMSSRDYGAPTVVRLGDNNLIDASDDAYVETISIKALIQHPKYNYPSQYYDLALLQLERAPKLSLHIRPACLFTNSNLNSDRAMATGWGLTEDLGDRSNVLLKVTLDFFDSPTCNKTYSSSNRLAVGIDDKIQVCAGSYTEEKDTCQGDSGGPLQFYSKTFCMYDIVGVTSFGQGCGFIGIPAVYTRVSSHLEWIEKTIWP